MWYSVPNVGHFSKNYARFQGNYLAEVAGCDCAVLDPRYPEVRSFLVDAYTEAVKQNGKHVTLKAFMGGTEDEPQVYVYDAEYGLTMLDLMDGVEVWTLTKNNCPLGDAAVCTIGENTGILYIAGTDGPDPVAISSEGNILWRSEIDDPEEIGRAHV